MTRQELADLLADTYEAERLRASWMGFEKLPFWLFQRLAHVVHDHLNPVAVVGPRDVDANGSPV